MLVCNVAPVPRKQRVETYLDTDDVEQVAELARARDISSSAVIRNAVQKEIENAEELTA